MTDRPDIGAIQVSMSEATDHTLIRATDAGLETLKQMVVGAKLGGWANITAEDGRERLRIERVAEGVIPKED